MRYHLKRTALHIVGWTLILIGLLGLLLPIMPGIVLIILGVYALSLTSVWFRTKKEALVIRYPKAGRFVVWLDTKFGHMNML